MRKWIMALVALNLLAASGCVPLTREHGRREEQREDRRDHDTERHGDADREPHGEGEQNR